MFGGLERRREYSLSPEQINGLVPGWIYPEAIKCPGRAMSPLTSDENILEHAFECFMTCVWSCRRDTVISSELVALV